MKGVRQADDLFVCFGAKPNRGLSHDLRCDRKWVSERERELDKGTQREELAKGDAEGHWLVDNGQQQRPVGMR